MLTIKCSCGKVMGNVETEVSRTIEVPFLCNYCTGKLNQAVVNAQAAQREAYVEVDELDGAGWQKLS